MPTEAQVPGMNWAMPCAPAGLPALGFQLLSASICAAMMLGVTISHTDPARITSLWYSAGTLSTLVVVESWTPPNRNENTLAIMTTTARIAARIAISGSPIEPMAPAMAVTAVRTIAAATRIMRTAVFAPSTVAFAALTGALRCRHMALLLEVTPLTPERPALKAMSRLAVPMRDASSVSACMRRESIWPAASMPLPPSRTAGVPMLLPTLRLARPAFLSFMILPLALASPTLTGLPLAALRAVLSLALYASRRLRFMMARPVFAVLPTPSRAPRTAVAVALAARFALSWPIRSAASVRSTDMDRVDETAPDAMWRTCCETRWPRCAPECAARVLPDAGIPLDGPGMRISPYCCFTVVGSWSSRARRGSLRTGFVRRTARMRRRSS